MMQNVRLRLAAADPAALLLGLAAALLIAGVLKDLVLLAVGRDREIANLVEFLTLQSGTDSWMPMYRAVELFLSDPAAGIYQTVFFDQQTKFQYPPMSLLPFVALSAVGVGRDAGVVLMQLLTFAGVIGIAAVTAMLYLHQRTSDALAAFRAKPLADPVVVAAIAVGTLTFDPIMYAYEVGQIQVLIDLAVGGALLAWLKGAKGTSGAVMALAALIKPQYGLVLLWSLLRREHRFSIGFLAVGAPVGLISLAVFGFAEHFAYLSVISYIGRHGELFWANQSVNGVLNRLLVEGDPMTWNAAAFAPYHPLVYAGTLATTVAFVLLGLGFRPRWTRRANAAGKPEALLRQESALDLATMIVALTLASPIAWEHHYGVTWPMMVLAFFTLIGVRAQRNDRLVLGVTVALAASYWLTSNYLTQLFPVVGTPFNVLQSYVLAGGLLLLGALVGLRIAMTPEGQASAAKPAGAAG